VESFKSPWVKALIIAYQSAFDYILVMESFRVGGNSSVLACEQVLNESFVYYYFLK